MAFIGNQIITINSLLDLDGQELVLDADADSTIHVSTDDQIDFKIGGTDVATFTNSSSDFVITQAVQDKDIIFKGCLLYTSPSPRDRQKCRKHSSA